MKPSAPPLPTVPVTVTAPVPLPNAWLSWAARTPLLIFTAPEKPELLAFKVTMLAPDLLIRPVPLMAALMVTLLLLKTLPVRAVLAVPARVKVLAPTAMVVGEPPTEVRARAETGAPVPPARLML